MTATLKLPDHVYRKSDKWFYNAKTGKWIPATVIEDWAAKYWKAHENKSKAVVNERLNFKRNVNAAMRRWED